MLNKIKFDMKKVFLLLALCTAFISCKNSEENKSDSSEVAAENLKVYRGEYLFLKDGAVLKGDSFIYGVTIDETAKALAERVKPVKKDSFDMVPVFVRGVVNPKPEGTEGWDEIITIKEIISISDKASEADIKIEEKKT
jgi:hypothetical protein